MGCCSSNANPPMDEHQTQRVLIEPTKQYPQPAPQPGYPAAGPYPQTGYPAAPPPTYAQATGYRPPYNPYMPVPPQYGYAPTPPVYAPYPQQQVTVVEQRRHSGHMGGMMMAGGLGLMGGLIAGAAIESAIDRDYYRGGWGGNNTDVVVIDNNNGWGGNNTDVIINNNNGWGGNNTDVIIDNNNGWGGNNTDVIIDNNNGWGGNNTDVMVFDDNNGW